MHSFLRDLFVAMAIIIVVMMLLFPLRSAIVAALTIPMSTFISVGMMYLCGIPLNTVTLAALVVVLGMIVDNSIVVIDVMVVSNLAKWKVSYLLPMALFGRHTGFPEVHMERCSSLSFQTDRAEPVHLDGESGGHRTEERIGLETERLRLLGDWVKEGMER